jgi:hypothetical protein
MKRMSLLALAVAVAAVVPTFAFGKPLPTAGNDRAHYGNQQADDPQYTLGPGEIPYLSQGVGVNKENFRGSVSTAQQRDIVPYLSQGVGVTSAELHGTAADDRSFSRAETIHPAPVVVSKDDGLSIDPGTSAISAFALVLGLLAGGMGVAMWRSRKTKLSPA